MYVRLGVSASTVPSWVHFGGEAGISYGCPSSGANVLKTGLHVTRGPGEDPDSPAPLPPGEPEALRARLARILTVPVRDLVGAERCLYTMTSDEGFVIDRWPGDPRVAFASACSGHGFKWAPMTGRILAELVVHGRAELPGDADVAALFALPAHRTPARPVL